MLNHGLLNDDTPMIEDSLIFEALKLRKGWGGWNE